MSSTTQHGFLSAGEFHDPFTVTYSPVLDMETKSPISSRENPSFIQHTFMTPVPPLEVEEQVEPVFINEPTLSTPDSIDVPNWKTISGTIIITIMIMLCISLFICLARPDFNFVFYLFGYYLWCIESKRHHVSISLSPGIYPHTSELRVASKSTVGAAKYYAVLLAGAVFIDLSWLYLASSAWLCQDGGEENCQQDYGSEETRKRIKATHHLHQFAVFGSILNVVGKSIVVILSILWLLQQQRHHKNLNSYSGDYSRPS